MDLIDACIPGNALRNIASNVLQITKKSSDSFTYSKIQEVVVVVHFRTIEHYEYRLQKDSKLNWCDTYEDAYAREQFRWQQRYFQYCIQNNAGADGSGPLERLFTDGLCHWTSNTRPFSDKPPTELPWGELNNTDDPRLTVWTSEPSAFTRAFADFGDEDFCFDDDQNITLAELTYDASERLDSEGGSEIEMFDFETDNARKVATELGCSLEDFDDLRTKLQPFRSKWFGQERIDGISGFGIKFSDGSYVSQCSADQTEIHGNWAFRNVMTHLVKELCDTAESGKALLESLLDSDRITGPSGQITPRPQTRLDALARLAALSGS